MTRGEGVFTSAAVALASAVITGVLFTIGRAFISTLPREPRAFAATVLVLLIIASALLTIMALVILASELIGWSLDAPHTTNAAHRCGTHPRAIHSVTTPFTRSQQAAEEATAELLRNALAKRDEALREAQHIARVLHLINQEIGK
jgi:hypothetical protein